jgi:Spy/CpxP family protein refolding chaperone
MKRIALTILILATIAATAVAAPRRNAAAAPQEGPRGEMPPAVLAELLDLTEAQQTQVQSLRETLRATVEPLHDTQRANHEQIRAAVEAGDAAKAGALLVANHGIAQQIKAARDAYRAGFEAILTAEQKTKFAVVQELMELRRERGPRGED